MNEEYANKHKIGGGMDCDHEKVSDEEQTGSVNKITS